MLKLLIVKTSSMGDVIHNLPIIADIRAHYPDAHFDWMVEESFAEIPKLHPDVGQVIPVAVRRWRKSIFSRNTWREISALKKHLNETRYDIIIDMQGLLKSVALAKLACREIHGMDYSSAREPLASLFYQYKYKVSWQLHAVQRNRALAALSLAYPIPQSPPNYGLSAIAHNKIHLQLPQSYVVCLHGTSRDSKLWPISHWVQLAHQLQEIGLNIVLPWSNPEEESRAKNIAAQCTKAVVLPKLNLTALTAILASAKLNIGVDTGLMHLSTALNKPSIAIYTDTNPAFTGVLAGLDNLAVNIGGQGLTPSANDVFQLALKFKT